MKTMLKKINGFIRDEEGQGMVEYGLIIGFIAVACIAVLGLMRDQLVNIFTKIKDALASAPGN